MLAASRSNVDPEKLESLRKFLISKLRQSWSDDPPFDVDQVAARLEIPPAHELRRTLDAMNRLAGLLAFSQRINGNPRIVKRMLNVIRMRASVARRRNMALDEAIIAKLLLFERCTGEDAIREFNRLVSRAPDGKVSFLAKLESSEAADIPGLLPKDWGDFAAFVSDWVKLHPPLGEVDLRPAVYLARETLPMRFDSSRLSSKTKKAVETLLKTTTTSSPASKQALKEIDPGEVGEAMDEMIGSFARNSDWAKGRDDFRGAVLLARRWPIAHEKLVRYVEGLPRVPRWITALMKDDTGGRS